MHTVFFLSLDKEIQKQLEVLQATTNERLEELADTVEQSNEKCCNATTGSFHNPAHNCSHIAHEHPDATSGRNNDVRYMEFVLLYIPSVENTINYAKLYVDHVSAILSMVLHLINSCTYRTCR